MCIPREIVSFTTPRGVTYRGIATPGTKSEPSWDALARLVVVPGKRAKYVKVTRAIKVPENARILKKMPKALEAVIWA